METGNISGPSAEATVRASLLPLLEAGADTRVLGCTHYPFLIGTIEKIAHEAFPQRNINVIDPAPAVARHLLEVMAEEDICEKSASGYSIELYASGDPANLQRTFAFLMK